MLVLHSAWVDERLCWWGESPPATAAPAAGSRGRKRGEAVARARLPFDAGRTRLGEVFREILPDRAPDAKSFGDLTAWLPTIAGQPLASHPLISPAPEASLPPSIHGWTVTAWRPAPGLNLDLLAACLDRERLASGVLIGQDVAFWAGVLRFASALVTREQFLPGVVVAANDYSARWEAVLLGADAERLGTLAQAMPHACRALSPTATEPPATPARGVVLGFVNACVDQLVRSADRENIVAFPGSSRRVADNFESIHDQWLHALRAPEGTMSGPAAELAEFARQVREWQRPIATTAAAPVRLCFRLEEPPPEASPDLIASPPANAAGAESAVSPQPRKPRARPAAPTPAPSAALPAGSWQVRYLLQAANDPSLLVPVEDAWQRRSAGAKILQRADFNVREYLLSALGQAAGICPRIEASLRAATPAGYEVDATGAFEFLSQTAAGLEQAGFGVLLPAWWTGKGTRQRLSARARVRSPAMQGGSGLSLEEIVHFDWEIALGDTPLTLAELEMLAKLKSPLVKIRGQWVQLTAAEIETALKLWKQKSAGQVPARELVRMALGAPPALDGVEFAGVDASGWIAELLAQLDGRAAFESLPAPAGFRGELRAYQVRGFSWLGFLQRWGLGACLADDMGLGKTIQVLAFALRQWETTRPGPLLLIAPTSVVGNWEKEAARFAPELPVLVHHGTERTRGAAFAQAAGRHALVVSSYSLLHRDLELFRGVAWSGVVLDEAQNIKNPETKQAKAARALPAPTRIALTGTPVENNVGDLWSIMEFLNPGFLGTAAEFKRRYFLPIQVDRSPEATARLKRLTGPFILRRLKTDRHVIADLPEKQEMKVFCPLTKEQASLYAAVVREASEALEQSDRDGEANTIQRRGVVLATLMKLKQVCNHPAQFLGDNSAIPGRSGKLARLTEMLEELLAVDDRALVFSQFTEMGELIQRHVQETFGREVLFLHGGVAKRARDRMVERFQNEADGPRVFLLSLKAGGTGLNLTRANHVFHFDRWWNPAVENQATDRAFRIGQTRNVQVHKFLCQGTLEERIDEMIERKQEIAANVVGAGEGWLTELSTADLKQLFALRAEAVQE